MLAIRNTYNNNKMTENTPVLCKMLCVLLYLSCVIVCVCVCVC